MPKKRTNPRPDFSQVAFRIVQQATGNAPKESVKPKNEAALALSKLGASKGGKARAKKLSSKKRREIARKAAKSRWAK